MLSLVELHDYIIIMQMVNAFFAVALLFHSILWLYRHKKRWEIALPVLVLAIHTLIYYIVVVAYKMHGTTINEVVGNAMFGEAWSSLIRFEGLITYIFVLVIFDLTLRGIYGKRNYDD